MGSPRGATSACGSNPSACNDQIYIDGQIRLSLYSTGPTQGRVGISTYRARADFDNVQVTPTPVYSIYRNNFDTTLPVPFASRVGDWHFYEYDYENAGVDMGLAQWSTVGEGRVSMGTPSADQRVEASARVKELPAAPTGTQRRWFGVVARYVDENNHYTLALRNSNYLVLSKRVNGQYTTLGSFAVNVVPDQYYLIRLDAIGNQLRAYLDNRLLFEATDSAHASGSPGLATFKAHAEYNQFVGNYPNFLRQPTLREGEAVVVADDQVIEHADVHEPNDTEAPKLTDLVGIEQAFKEEDIAEYCLRAMHHLGSFMPPTSWTSIDAQVELSASRHWIAHSLHRGMVHSARGRAIQGKVRDGSRGHGLLRVVAFAALVAFALFSASAIYAARSYRRSRSLAPFSERSN